jgi:Fe-S-cluster-containing dehydrogenase component/DMSO reductase anchor subunit
MNLLSAVDAVDATPIDRWVAAQGDLSAVERFSQRHADEQRPVQARYYRDLLPAQAPGPGQQYAFAVDLDACTGCKACVAACHSLNGLDDDEEWRRVTLLTGWHGGQAHQQHVTAACHHCVEPACMHGCPVDAYEKDPITGIVTHLDDQCIGCSYCTLTCPYEVPAYDQRRGIVRKCDMCAGRLAEGEAPACVQGCPNGAIGITVVDVAATVAVGATGSLVPGTPPSAITRPSTRYRSERGIADGAGAFAAAPAPATVAHAHPPLTVMLVFTQLAVGAFVADLLLRWVSERGAGALPAFDAVVVVVAGLVALGASVLHLGRPLHCYRAVIGLRHSWLSREVVAFGAFTGLALPYAFVIVAAPDALGSFATRGLGVAVAATGLLGVACSVLIYSRTRRASWTVPVVAAKFALTTAVCGVATVLWMSAVGGVVGAASGLDTDVATERWLFLAVALITAAKLGAEASVFLHLRGSPSPSTEAARRARVLTGPLRVGTNRRYGFGLVAGVALPLAAAALVGDAMPSILVAVVTTVVLAGVVAGELIERTTFFTAASAPR